MRPDPFVLWLQKQLNAAGAHPPLTLDGVPGRRTQAALLAFQATHKLPGTGLADTATVAALRAPKAGGAVVPADTPPWVALARTKMGLQEKRDNAELRRFLRSDGTTLGDPSKLPWCGDFVETCVAVTLPREPMVVNPYYALNWLKFGVAVGSVQLGAVAVFERPGGGHVGFVVGHDATALHVLGGNQSNSVSVARVAKSRLRGLRWPGTYPAPTGPGLPETAFDATLSENEA